MGRIHKIRPVLSHRTTSFLLNLRHFKKTAIDETLFLYKGKLTFQQFIPSKGARFGIKMFVIPARETVLSSLPYLGAETELEFVELNEKMA